MAPVKLKYVVSFTSQDPKFPVENLLIGDSSKKWLSAPSDKSSQLEAVFQLEKSCVITHIDIGTWWTFSVEIQVGRSTWPETKGFKSLLPSCAFMNPIECKQGKNKVGLRMFNTEQFSADTRDESWDRIRVVLSQPYRKDVQFGLSVLRILAADNEMSSKKSMVCSHTKSIVTGISPISKQLNGLAQPKGGLGLLSPFRQIQNSDSVTQKLNNSECEKMLQGNMSRTAKLLKAAVSKTPKYKVIERSPDELRKQRKTITFDDEVKRFLKKLDIKKLIKENENLEFCVLRHQLEKLKHRKLSKVEKKRFLELTVRAVEDCVSEEEEKQEVDASSRPDCTEEDVDTSVTSSDTSDGRQNNRVVVSGQSNSIKLTPGTGGREQPEQMMNGCNSKHIEEVHLENRGDSKTEQVDDRQKRSKRKVSTITDVEVIECENVPKMSTEAISKLTGHNRNSDNNKVSYSISKPAVNSKEERNSKENTISSDNKLQSLDALSQTLFKSPNEGHAGSRSTKLTSKIDDGHIRCEGNMNRGIKPIGSLNKTLCQSPSEGHLRSNETLLSLKENEGDAKAQGEDCTGRGMKRKYWFLSSDSEDDLDLDLHLSLSPGSFKSPPGNTKCTKQLQKNAFKNYEEIEEINVENMQVKSISNKESDVIEVEKESNTPVAGKRRNSTATQYYQSTPLRKTPNRPSAKKLCLDPLSPLPGKQFSSPELAKGLSEQRNTDLSNKQNAQKLCLNPNSPLPSKRFSSPQGMRRVSVCKPVVQNSPQSNKENNKDHSMSQEMKGITLSQPIPSDSPQSNNSKGTSPGSQHNKTPPVSKQRVSVCEPIRENSSQQSHGSDVIRDGEGMDKNKSVWKSLEEKYYKGFISNTAADVQVSSVSEQIPVCKTALKPSTHHQTPKTAVRETSTPQRAKTSIVCTPVHENQTLASNGSIQVSPVQGIKHVLTYKPPEESSPLGYKPKATNEEYLTKTTSVCKPKQDSHSFNPSSKGSEVIQFSAAQAVKHVFKSVNNSSALSDKSTVTRVIKTSPPHLAKHVFISHEAVSHTSVPSLQSSTTTVNTKVVPERVKHVYVIKPIKNYIQVVGQSQSSAGIKASPSQGSNIVSVCKSGQEGSPDGKKPNVTINNGNMGTPRGAKTVYVIKQRQEDIHLNQRPTSTTDGGNSIVQVGKPVSTSILKTSAGHGQTISSDILARNAVTQGVNQMYVLKPIEDGCKVIEKPNSSANTQISQTAGGRGVSVCNVTALSTNQKRSTLPNQRLNSTPSSRHSATAATSSNAKGQTVPDSATLKTTSKSIRESGNGSTPDPIKPVRRISVCQNIQKSPPVNNPSANQSSGLGPGSVRDGASEKCSGTDNQSSGNSGGGNGSVMNISDTLDDSWLSTRSSENPLDKSKTKVKVTARGRGQVKVKDSELSRGHSGRSGTERGRGRRKSREVSRSANNSGTETLTQSEQVTCPICNGRFPSHRVVEHAATCGLFSDSSGSDSDDSFLDNKPKSNSLLSNNSPTTGSSRSSKSQMIQSDKVTEYLGVARMLDVYSSQTASQMAAPQLGLCPICGQNVLLSDLEVHADRCASSLD